MRSRKFPHNYFSSISSVGFPIFGIHIVLKFYVTYNKIQTLSCCTGFPTLGFSEAFSPKITVSIFFVFVSIS